MLSLSLSLSKKSWLNLQCEKKHKKLKKHDMIRNKMKYVASLPYSDHQRQKESKGENAKQSQAQIIIINEKHKLNLFLHIPSYQRLKASSRYITSTLESINKHKARRTPRDDSHFAVNYAQHQSFRRYHLRVCSTSDGILLRNLVCET